MREDIARRWIEELRSGRHPQTIHKMCDEKGMCCLGVLQIKVLGLPLSHPDKAVMDDEARMIAGMDNETGCIRIATDEDEVGGFKVDVELYVLNDSGKTFPEIADIIEARWPEL